jgi:stearoyl-CoA desaturase (delta-9 desaturase)
MNSQNTSHPVDENAPLNLPVTLVLGLSFLVAITIVPWYGFTHGFSGTAWILFAVFLVLNGMGIGSGYHRLWSHRTYQAHWLLRIFLAIAGGASLQNSILVWCSRHRLHHRYVDDNDRDPYSIGRGFWFAHIGWMLRNYPSSKIDLGNVQDLQKDPVAYWQHRLYWPLVAVTNIGIPMLAGWLTGEFWGVFLLAGVFRLVVNHHVTFFINSLAHMWGKRPYSDSHSARDNWLLSIVTYGEGYHNYHHEFQADYRNGIRWWQFDLNKWFIATCAGLGLAWDLKRAPRFKVLQARLNMEFRRARERLQMNNEGSKRWAELLEREYAQFSETLKQWQVLQLERVRVGKQKLARRWETNALRTRFRELEYSLKMQRKRLALMASLFNN